MHNSGLNETVERPAPETPVPGLRQLTYADLPVVISIERRSFTTPWSPGMFVLEMSKSSTISLAAVEDDRLIGYAVFSRYDAAWHMMNVAVAPEHRRRGVASALINGALERIEPGDAPVTLEVRPSNKSAISLYGTFGFRSFGYRKGYYANGEDAMIMWRGDPALAGVPAEAAAGS